MRKVLRGAPNVRYRQGEVVDVDFDAQARAPRRRRRARRTTRSCSRRAASPTTTATTRSRARALGLKDLGEALQLRNHVLDCLERAAAATDADERRAAADVLHRRRRADRRRVRGRARRARAARAAARVSRVPAVATCGSCCSRAATACCRRSSSACRSTRAASSNVAASTCAPSTLVASADERGVVLRDGTELPTATIVWTAGVRPSVVPHHPGVTHTEQQRFAVDDHLRILGAEHVYAIGDVAAAPDQRRRAAADALAARDAGRPLRRPRRSCAARRRRFRYRDKGTMATIGRRAAVAQIGPLQLTGLHRLGRVARRAPLLPDRLREPAPGDAALGLVLRAPRPARPLDPAGRSRPGTSGAPGPGMADRPARLYSGPQASKERPWQPSRSRPTTSSNGHRQRHRAARLLGRVVRPCRQFGPVFEQAAADNPDIVFGKVDTEASPSSARAFDIMSIPTLMIFREQVLVFSQPGALPAAALENLIEQVRALDMEAVHAEIAKQQARRGSRPRTLTVVVARRSLRHAPTPRRSCYKHRWRVLIAWIVVLVGVNVLAQTAGGDSAQDVLAAGHRVADARSTCWSRDFARKGDTGDLVFKVRGDGDRARRPHVQAEIEPMIATLREAAARRVGRLAVRARRTRASSRATARSRTPRSCSTCRRTTCRSISRRTCATIVSKANTPSVQIELGGSMFTDQTQPASEAIGILAAVLILLLAFGSLLAMGLPIMTALFGIGIGLAIVTLLARVHRHPVVRAAGHGDDRHRRRHRLRAVHQHPLPRGAARGRRSRSVRSCTRSTPAAGPCCSRAAPS